VALGALSAVPSGPQNGDVWVEIANHSFTVRVNGANRNIGTLTRATPTYGATVTIDCGLATFFDIVANNGTAFTISNPLLAVTGRRISVRVQNTSGGALGAVTWSSQYKMAAWTSPATGFSRTIDFQYDGTNWIEFSRTTVDVPN